MRPKQLYRYQKNTVKSFCTKEAGFTIIEVLLAVSILAVGIMAIATMQYSAIRVNSTANHLTVRTTYAQDTLERLMALPYSHADLKDDESEDVLLSTEHSDTSVSGVEIKWYVNDNVTLSNSKYIVVKVKEAGKTVELVTVRSANI